MSALHPWEGLMFEWQQRRASAPRIALMLRDGGLEKPLKPASLEALDGWIADPVKALGEATAQDVMQLVLVTQYFDTLKSIGESDKTNTLFLSHTPGAVKDIGDQIMQSMIAADKAG